MSDIAGTAPVANTTPNAAPAAGSEPTNSTNNGWPTTKLVDNAGQLSPSDDAQPGLETSPNPDDPWMPDETLAEKKTRLKVDGKDIDVAVKDLHKYAQLGIAANARMQEAARIRQEASDSHTMLAESMRDPNVFFARMIEADEGAAIQWIDRLAQVAADRLQMSPEQRELDRYKRTEQGRREQQEQQQHKQAVESMQRAWGKAVELAGLQGGPIDTAIASEMRERVQIARREGRNETPRSLAAFAKQRRGEMEQAFQRTLSAEQRQAMIRPEDLQQQARERATKPLMQSTPARADNGQFQGSKPKAQFYDPYA